MSEQRAVLAGGCFWGMQDLIRKLPGVVATRVGYTGGDVQNATYRNHGSHAEGIEILFDSELISYRTLLELFFQIHDPTTVNRQGNDCGMSYRSAIYFVDEAQKKTALDTIADVEASGLWPGKVVTEVEPVSDFWLAEPEHQDYLERYPGGYTCHFPRPDWVLPKRQVADLAGDMKLCIAVLWITKISLFNSDLMKTVYKFQILWKAFMSYELTGKIKLIQDPQTFNSGFTKREMVVTVDDGKYPQEINLEFVQDKVSLLDSLQVGQQVTVSFDIRGREYNGRYFNNLVGWKVQSMSASEDSERDQFVSNIAPQPADFDDDIPF